MAAKLLPLSLLTVATLSGFNYTTHYQHPKSHDKPYILFIHGFPSSAYDWKHQVSHFADKGYGIIAPDTLGYGSTDAPLTIDPYRALPISNSILEVVNAVAGPSAKIHGVGHDWGTAMLSRMADFNSTRFLSYAFLAGSYHPPVPFDVDAVNALTQKLLGYSTLGYWKFFNQTDAGDVIDKNKESFAELLYPRNDSAWKSTLGPVGAARSWVESGTRGPHATYLSEEEFKTHLSIFAQKGYTPALGYYRATMAGLQDKDNAQVPVGQTTKIPTLQISGTLDALLIEAGNDNATRLLAPEATCTNVTAAHWMQLEVPDKVNKLLEMNFQRGEGRGVV